MIIVIEGCDQAGKKTQSQLLAAKLNSKKLKTKLFSFPDYTTPIGKEISRYLEGGIDLDPKIIHCLLAANRYEKIQEVNEAIEKNSILVMNRYYQSNWVYGLVNGIKLDWLEKLDSGLPKADLVIVLDVSQQESFKRKKTNRDKFEKNKSFYKKIAETYKTLAIKKRWKIVDATRTKDKVHEDIMKILHGKLIK